jgi:hypothetical protein
MLVDVPFSAGVPDGYVRRQFVVTLDATQAEALRRVQDEMVAGEIALTSGKTVRSGGDAIRGILESISAAE